MSFADLPEQRDAVQLLQRSLERGRLGHAYLFGGTDLVELERIARTLAKAVNCQAPARRSPEGLPLDSCDKCDSCRRIEDANHPDISWIRPESKSRVITIEQMRDLMQTINLKPTVARFKFGIIVAADRLNVQAANAFLKTLEEPPSNSILVLLSIDTQRIIETILSRCLRLNFAGEATAHAPEVLNWVAEFIEMASGEQRSLLSRYRLLSVLLKRLTELKSGITEALTKRSPLERYDDVDPHVREKWEEELSAAIEAEYRRQRTDLLGSLQWWLRDLWLSSMQICTDSLSFPQLTPSLQKIARRISPAEALQNLQLLEETQRLLSTNVQEG